MKVTMREIEPAGPMVLQNITAGTVFSGTIGALRNGVFLKLQGNSVVLLINATNFPAFSYLSYGPGALVENPSLREAELSIK